MRGKQEGGKSETLAKEKQAHANCDRSESMKRYHEEKRAEQPKGGKKGGY